MKKEHVRCHSNIQIKQKIKIEAWFKAFSNCYINHSTPRQNIEDETGPVVGSGSRIESVFYSSK